MLGKDITRCILFLQRNKAYISPWELKYRSDKPDILIRKRKFRKIKRRFIKEFPQFAYLTDTSEHHPMMWVFFYLMRTRKLRDYNRYHRS